MFYAAVSNIFGMHKQFSRLFPIKIPIFPKFDYKVGIGHLNIGA